MFGAGFWAFAAKPKPRPQINQAQKDTDFRQLFASVFSKWDVNHDGQLDLKELNAVIENPQVREGEAAIAVFLHRHLQVDEEERTNGLTLPEVLSLADDPAIQKIFPERRGTSRPSTIPCSHPAIRTWNPSIKAASGIAICWR